MRPLLVADALALVSAGAVAYAVAEAVAAPAVIAPGWTLAPLALAAVVTLLGSFALHGLYERQSREIAPQTFDEVTTLLHALLTASVLWLLVSQTLFRLAGYAIFTPMEAVLFVAAGLGIVAVARWATRAWVVPASSSRAARSSSAPVRPAAWSSASSPPTRSTAWRSWASSTTTRAPPPRCWAPRPS